MNHTIISIKEPQNEPVLSYAPGTPERHRLKKELERIANEQIEVPVIIGGKEYTSGDQGKMIMPHNHHHVLGRYHKANEKLINLAVETAVNAQKDWERLPWMERASINLRAAELINREYRYTLNAATMLNQSKNVHQAEIDAACEVADFLRFNAYYMSIIYREQPHSERDTINRLGYRALEGFVFAVSPFNFTSIAANLPTAPVLMGNAALWKPASSAVLSAYYLMRLFKEAGYPGGVINFIPGPGSKVGKPVLSNYHLAGIHFTGSTAVFQGIWKQIGENIGKYRTYPRIVGETGGKNFIIVHPSADLHEVAAAVVRGGFEYQGQKCSAASRIYIPTSKWNPLKKILEDMISQIKIGDPRDFSNFMNAVIDEPAFDKIMGYIKKAEEDTDTEIIFGGRGDKSTGYFIEPTVLLTTNPHFITMEEEIFGPVVTCYLYDEAEFENTLHLCDETSPYGLTGAIFAHDRRAIQLASDILRHAAGNFYINDKPTGAVVGEQPFGGGRASGTNDKAGSHINLHRWVSPRAIKENLYPPTDFKYPFMN
ncbi:MAG: L-glutamate gamma-semialdehyde dehydrogenase [Candidatus Aminicenantes bacterium]|nr:L-glutamate gamma-semialdehyde dehydrogenase [Candidatus Aminicenantes bacterium]NIM84235.1 L-glutamate gamma-semialdehyde dehydrogenase [Candidatus Aminicenantes bacterium]NIN23684.1 L-glutamate gamma-semialdehyde dehydrogenase [Candidatus Aminicenantes bacterium]NIN47391.1 L-glutamate gamma-semialdehyde dehydrogenase [Candidatus Aminicenantes bacterium]NIN90319.1 L-glutamate gamma-semialdehyde dehydrogenase [Candidatus Aminicenantes bacterium]